MQGRPFTVHASSRYFSNIDYIACLPVIPALPCILGILGGDVHVIMSIDDDMIMLLITKQSM
jgi:hypothetical protein